jgi:CHASE2 domain-containing sensor protein
LIEDEVLRFCITAALSATTAYCAFRAGSKSPMVVRVNNALHTLMTLAMIAMLFPGWDWPLLPQLLAFALAAWWFTGHAE